MVIRHNEENCETSFKIHVNHINNLGLKKGQKKDPKQVKYWLPLFSSLDIFILRQECEHLQEKGW